MINHIELAKECGAQVEDYHNPSGEWLGCDYAMSPPQLAAFTNAIIEQCAKVADDRQKQVGDSTNEFSILATEIRALRVKG